MKLLGAPTEVFPQHLLHLTQALGEALAVRRKNVMSLLHVNGRNPILSINHLGNDPVPLVRLVELRPDARVVSVHLLVM